MILVIIFLYLVPMTVLMLLGIEVMNNGGAESGSIGAAFIFGSLIPVLNLFFLITLLWEIVFER